MLARGVNRQASPTAADVEHPLAGLQLELAADQLELGALGVLERRRSGLEQRAAVGHRLVKEQGEELVRDVVVVADRLGVAALRVAVARAGAARRRGVGTATSPAARSAATPNPSRRGRLSGGGMPAAEQRDDPIQVVDVDLPAHVGAPEPELAGRAQKVADRPRRADRDGRAVARRRNARAVPELDRERTICKRPLNCATQPVGARPRHGASLTQRLRRHRAEMAHRCRV